METYQLREKAVALPVVDASEHGNGKAQVIRTIYDLDGRVTWVKSPRGYITRFQYDPLLGTLVRQVDDVNTAQEGGVPPGWSTPPGGGLNLATDYEYDQLGRQTLELGPWHQAQISDSPATSVSVRTVQMALFIDKETDGLREVRTAAGYATASGNPEAPYDFVTVGSVTLSRIDAGGNEVERIEATRASNVGLLSPGETFPQSSWKKWTRREFDRWGRLLRERVYHKIPSSGEGDPGDYEEQAFAYDKFGRLIRSVDATGTITRKIYDETGLVTSRWVGTDDTGWNGTNPPGTGNNMVEVVAYEYDDNLPGGNGNLTKSVAMVDDDSDHDRAVKRAYDFRNRLIRSEAEDQPGRKSITALSYDNLDRRLYAIRYSDQVGEGHYLSKLESSYDPRGRLFLNRFKGAADGVLTTHALESRRWYDASGNVVKGLDPNSDAAVKLAYDGMERNLARYVVIPGSDGSSSSSPSGSSSSSSSSSSDDEPVEPSSSSGSSSSGSSGGSSGGSGDSQDGGSSSSGSSSSSSGSSSGSSSDSSSSDSGSNSSGSSSGAPPVDNQQVPDTQQPKDCCEGGPGYPHPDELANPGVRSNKPCPPPGNSGAPVTYSNGSLVYGASDLAWSGLGFSWSHSRAYGNRLGSGPVGGINGNKWVVPYLSYVRFNVGPTGNWAVVVYGGNEGLWFKPDGATWKNAFGGREQLLVGVSEITLILPDGSKEIYYSTSGSIAEVKRGRLKRVETRANAQMNVDYNSSGGISRVSWSRGGRSSAFDYTFYGAWDGPARSGRLKQVVHSLDGSGVSSVEYDYHDGNNTHGLAGDLKSAITRRWDGTEEEWVLNQQYYYRYYKGDDGGVGFAHGLKLVLDPLACQRFIDEFGPDFDSYVDDILKPFADFYFEYDSASHRVSSEKVRGVGGESAAYTYSYHPNPNAPGMEDVDVWAMKTVVGRPDGSEERVYTNLAGQMLAKIFETSNGRKWYGAWEYSPEYRLLRAAASSSIEGIDEPTTSNGHILTVDYRETGLIQVYKYFATTNNSGAAEGYLSEYGVQEGSLESSYGKVRSYKYGTFDPSGTKVHPVVETTEYPGSGKPPATWKSEYRFYGSNQIVGTTGEVEEIESGLPNDVSHDKVFEQNLWTYDESSREILGSRSERFHDAYGNGPLKGPKPEDGDPHGRRTYVAIWYDGIGRQRHVADYGTNRGMVLDRPSTAPLQSSNDALVTTTIYAGSGEANETIDPKGTRTRWKNDAMGRRIEMTENYVPGGTAQDENRLTKYGYFAGSLLGKLTVVNDSTGDQETRWEYGVDDSTGSEIASNRLLHRKLMPTGSEEYVYCCNRQGQVIKQTDPNTTAHEYDYDGFGRLRHDRATVIPSHIDGTVRKLSYSYDSSGRIDRIGSYDDGDAILNEIEILYTAFGQLALERQSHQGSAGEGTPAVGYAYKAGEGNRISRTSCSYPSGRTLHYGRGEAGSDNYLLGRVQNLFLQPHSSSPLEELANYQFVGIDRFIRVAYTTPGIELSYLRPGSTGTGDAGDPYTGWDRYGRTSDMRWVRSSNGAYLDRIKYGYNKASLRTWMKIDLDGVDGQDECYQYDGFYQLTQRARGDLNNNHDAIGGTPARQEDFDYDPTGNWNQYDVIINGGSPLVQTRDHNKNNQITAMSAPAVPTVAVGYDAAGNMTSCPPGAGEDWSESRELKWDAWNRLVEVRESSSGPLVAAYRYDGVARRITKTVDGQDRHFYYNDQRRVVEERVGSAAGPAEQVYDWGIRYRDDLIRRDRWPQGSSSSSSDSSSDSGTSDSGTSYPIPAESLYVLHDYYNVVGITDQSGAVVERYGYSAFGDLRVMDSAFGDRAASAYDWNVLFKAQCRDAETGFYDYGYRYFSPLLGRWLSRDPIGEFGGINLYGFINNSPASNNDFLGACPELFNYWGDVLKGLWDNILESFLNDVVLPAVGKRLTQAALTAIFDGPLPIGDLIGLGLGLWSAIDAALDIWKLWDTYHEILPQVLNRIKNFDCRCLPDDLLRAFATGLGAGLATIVVGAVGAAGVAAGAALAGLFKSQEKEIVRRFLSKGDAKIATKSGIKYDPEKGAGISTTRTTIEPVNPDRIREMTGAQNADYYIDINIAGKPRLETTTKAGHADIKVQADINPEDIVDKGRVRKSQGSIIDNE